MKDLPNYYAVIPAEVRYCEFITPNAKLLYGELTALASKDGFCWASNTYFASLYRTSDRAISQWIASLIDAGFITSSVLKGNIRKIKILSLKKPVKKKGIAEIAVEEKFHQPLKKTSTTDRRKLLDNSTVNSTDNNIPDEPVFNFDEYVANMMLNDRKDIKLIGYYLKLQAEDFNITYLNKEAIESIIKRNVRDAKDILTCDRSAIIAAFERVRQDSDYGKKFEWKLSTVKKKLIR